MAAIEIQGLSKRFGEVAAVDDLSFTAREGAVTGFLGPNGAGKSTTLRMLLGLVRPSQGSATIGGKPYAAMAEPFRRVGAVLEADAFHPGRRARDHLRVLATAAGLPLARVDAVLREVDLADVGHRRVKGFSLGMRQRLGLASALLGEPEVLILDEPANGLDPEGVHWLRQFVRAFADRGGTVLVSSHVLAEVAQTVDDVVIIANGGLVTQSSLAELANLVACFGVSKQGIDFEARDGRPSHFFFALVAPENSAGVHLKALSKVSRLFRSDVLREAILSANTAEEIYALIAQEDARA